MNVIVTGGAGFIGSELVRYLIKATGHHVLNIDKLTYAGSLASLASVSESPRYSFKKLDVSDRQGILQAITIFQPNIVFHLAAESHVDRSIAEPLEFIKTNVLGTAVMLDAVNAYLSQCSEGVKNNFRFHHISTDEVYGSLEDGQFFTEDTPYAPSSPYSASKASSDHLVRAWHHTYQLPVIITNCSNNYGPHQFPEKLIPLVINKILEGEKIPIYGNGMQVRDWLHVEDHVEALYKIVLEGRVGETYNVGGNNEKTNLEVVHLICDLIDKKLGYPIRGKSSRELIEFVQDRAGHDIRYAIDASKLKSNLGWEPKKTFENGLSDTVDWYVQLYKERTN
jgi:dTDP-glucose 4,6-dehydratase